MAFAAAALCSCLYVLLRKRAVAEADRPVGYRHEELGWLDRVHVRPGKEPLILVFDRKHNVYVALHAAEVRDERAAPLVRVGHVEGRRVLAALERHLDAGSLAVRPLVGEVALDVAAYRPVDRIRIRLAASDAPGVRVLESDVARHRRNVFDVQLLLAGEIVFSPCLARHDRRGGRHDFGLYCEALRAAARGAVH